MLVHPWQVLSARRDGNPCVGKRLLNQLASPKQTIQRYEKNNT